MPYRESEFHAPKIPWAESTTFRLLQFTLFPVLRLVILGL